MLLFIILLIGSVAAHDFECQHGPLPVTKTNTHQKFTAAAQSSGELPNLRIGLIYTKEFESLLLAEKIKTEMLEPAVNFWKGTLKVKNPLTSPLLIDRQCRRSKMVTINNQQIRACYDKCEPDMLPDIMLAKCHIIDSNGTVTSIGKDGQGIDTDLVLFVTNSDKCEPGVLASATSLRLDMETDRPVLGMVRICSNNMDLSKAEAIGIALVHEIAHVLSFSSSLYAFFRDANGRPLTPRSSDGYPNLGKNTAQEYIPHENTFKIFNKTEITPIGQKTKQLAMLTTPNVLREARNHFNCSSLSGVLMEDQNGPTNGWSHLEKRLFYSDLMSPTIGKTSFVSRLDLAVMEDSGWYIPNYKFSFNIDFGRNLGCEFTNSSCYEYLQLQKSRNSSASPYCYESDRLQCSTHRKSYSKCILSNASSDFPAEYRYLEDKSLINYDPFTDYCPMYPDTTSHQTIIDENVIQCDSNITSTSIQSNEILKYVYSINNKARCFDSPKIGQWNSAGCNNNELMKTWGAGCYKYRCSSVHRLVVSVNNEEFQCVRDGQILDITTTTNNSTIHGMITCPKCSDFCNINQCNINPIVIKHNNSPGLITCNISTPSSAGTGVSMMQTMMYSMTFILLSVSLGVM